MSRRVRWVPTLEELEAVARGAAPAPLDAADRDADRRRPRRGRARAGDGRGRVRRDDRLRAARERADRARRRRPAPGQPACARTPSAPGRRCRRRSCAGCCSCSPRRCGAGTPACGAELVELVLALLERDVIPVIPSKGSVGSSGDLAPLAHLGLVLIGEGEATFDGDALPGGEALARAGLEPVDAVGQGGPGDHQRHAPDGGGRRARGPRRRSGCSTRRSSRWRSRSRRSRARPSRSTRGCTSCAASRVRPPSPSGCARCSRRARWWPATPTAAASRTRTRCAARRRCSARSSDALAYVAAAIERELDAVTDNPLVFPTDDSILSGGNFHGQPLSLPLDHLALALMRAGLVLRAPHLRAALPRLRRPAAVPDAAARPQLGPDDRPVRRRRARQRVPGARASGRRRVDPHQRRAGGLQLDGRAGGAEGAHRDRERRAGDRHRAGVRGAGPRVPPAAAQHAGARGGRSRACASTFRAWRRTARWRRELAALADALRTGELWCWLRCRGWVQEAALRMLENNLHPDVAEQPGGPRRLRRDRQGRAQPGVRWRRSSAS